MGGRAKRACGGRRRARLGPRLPHGHKTAVLISTVIASYLAPVGV